MKLLVQSHEIFVAEMPVVEHEVFQAVHRYEHPSLYFDQPKMSRSKFLTRRFVLGNFWLHWWFLEDSQD